MRRVQGQVALVTGASSDIGRAIAVTLAQLGCNVALTGRDETRLLDTAQRCQNHGVKAIMLTADLRNEQELERVVDQCVGTLGRLDILVHSAGVFDWAAAAAADLARWDELLDVNLRAAMRLTRLALPHVMKRGGAVVFIASLAGRFAFGMNAAYVASKHDLVGFAGSVFENVRAADVKVCAICPGLVDAGASREMNASEATFAQFIQPQDVADAVRFVVESSATVGPTEIRLSPQRTPFKQAET